MKLVPGLQPGVVRAMVDWKRRREGLPFSFTDCPHAEMQGHKVPHLPFSKEARNPDFYVKSPNF